MSTQITFCRKFKLDTFREHEPKNSPALHQTRSLNALKDWYHNKSAKNGALLVIPTGGGKTYTAVRFLCQRPLNDGYKIIWLAHTHHLLEQAFYTFAPENEEEIKRKGVEISNVRRESGELTIRVVSGEQNHSKLADVEKTDDVLICTLQTIVNGFSSNHKKLNDFFDSTSKVFIVFDEAHHTPADTFRDLMQKLQRLEGKTTYSLGLTATPHHSDENKKKWFHQIYPQGILPQPAITISELQADSILSKVNVLEPKSTDFTPTFTDADFKKWQKSFHNDLPENIITELANSLARNTIIANTYDKVKFGKTIIFADRWYQCEAICQLLIARGVKAGAIYSNVTLDNSNADDRNLRRRDKSQMAKDLEAFRKKEGGLDVLVNINILTEGTDVPSVNTVFLTRQTTSEIKLRQMIGRALRGPKFGGTIEANIVLFVDNWTMGNIMGEFASLPTDIPYETEKAKQKKHIPILISTELIRALTHLQDKGQSTTPLTFDELFPIGWYEAIFEAVSSENNDDVVQVRRLILVFKHEDEEYKKLIQFVKAADKTHFKDVSTTIDDEVSVSKIADWKNSFFNNSKSVSGDIERNIFFIIKHLSFNDDIEFYPFEDRELHRIDDVANRHLGIKNLARTKERELLENEYHRTDRFWKTLYPTFNNFRFHYDLVMNKLTDDLVNEDEKPKEKGVIIEITHKEEEVSKHIKEAVKKRDKNMCVCCGETKRLEVDHIIPKHQEKNHDMTNLQTLCKTCHSIKSKYDNTPEALVFNFIQRINSANTVNIPFEVFKKPNDNDKDDWSKFIRRYFNFLYHSNAVDKVIIGARGERFYNWEFTLYSTIDKKIGKKMLTELLKYINETKATKIKTIQITS